MKILPEPGWERLLSALRAQQGTVLLLGATDAGKSTLARYIVSSLATRCIRTALIDADIGQSGIGLPGTISLKVFCNQRDIEDFGYERMSFLGFTSPSKVIPLMAAMTKRLIDIGMRSAEIAVVDTTGLISGELGKALKMAKIRAIRPAHIVAVQRGDELEHILSLISDMRIHRLKTSSAAERRSASSRSAYRKRKLAAYFTTGDQAELILDASDIQFFYRGRSFHLRDWELPQRAIIGLNHNDDDTIALGIITEVVGTAINCRSPLRSPKGINRVICGDMTMTIKCGESSESDT